MNPVEPVCVCGHRYEEHPGVCAWCACDEFREDLRTQIAGIVYSPRRWVGTDVLQNILYRTDNTRCQSESESDGRSGLN